MARGLDQTFRLARKTWGGNGSGSSDAKTAVLVEKLPPILKRLGVKSLLDVGCGDVTWMVKVCEAAGIAHYTGVDIVPEVAEANSKAFPGAESFARFLTLDPRTLAMPAPHKTLKADAIDDQIKAMEIYYDLVLCRDTLAHLGNQTAAKMLASMKATGAKYLLATTYPASRNSDITDGKFRPLNLTRIPFAFPEPLEVIVEGDQGKHMGLWAFAELSL